MLLPPLQIRASNTPKAGPSINVGHMLFLEFYAYVYFPWAGIIPVTSSLKL